MRVCISFNAKGVLVILALLCMVCMAFAQPPKPWRDGDYWFTPHSHLTAAKLNNTTGWERYNGTSWVAATQSIISQGQTFNNNIHIGTNSGLLGPYNNDLEIDQNFTLNGNLTCEGDTKITISGIGTTFTLGEHGSCTLHSMDVNPGACFVNEGTTTFTSGNSKLALKYFGTVADQGAGGLNNQGTINLPGHLEAQSEALITSGPNGKIVGAGYITTPDPGDVQFRIANAGGWDEAIQLTGSNVVSDCCYVFNGDTDQVTGNIPSPIFSLTVNSGHKLALSKDIEITGGWTLAQGSPYVKVVSGSTLDLGEHTITSTGDDIAGVSTFILEDGATLITAHPNGISSLKQSVNGYTISHGAIQMNNATYSSGANYVFNGTGGRQFSGCFVTSGASNTVHNLTNESTHGVDLCPQFRPLEVTGVVTGEFNTNPDIPIYGYIRAPTLPVTMSYFNAVFNGFDSVILQWETQTETNNLGFYVLRAEVPDAGQANVVSELVPAVNSSQGAVYCFEDEDLYNDGIYYYWLQDVSFAGEIELHGPAMAQVTLSGGGNHSPDIPLKTSFTRNYPNPFNPSTQLEYYLEKDSDVNFKVYNLKGQLVDQITLRNQPGGFHRYIWEPQLSSGIYLIRFTAAGRSNTRKVILSK